MKDTDPDVIVEQVYDAPPAKVWSAITEPDQMRAWYFEEMKEFEPREGFETSFSLDHDGKTYIHTWKLIEVVPEKKIVYDWSYGGLPGRGEVVWELIPEGDGTKIKLTNGVVESFPDDDPAFKRESAIAGWTYFLQERLKEYLQE